MATAVVKWLFDVAWPKLLVKIASRSDENHTHDLIESSWQERVKTRFNTLDKDNSGAVSLKEMQDSRLYKEEDHEVVAEMFKKIDADGDGMVTMEELEQSMDAAGEKNQTVQAVAAVDAVEQTPFNLTRVELAESVLLGFDWLSDAGYLQETFTTTGFEKPLEDIDRCKALVSNCTSICETTCAEDYPFDPPVWILAMLVFGCLSGATSDVIRTRLLAKKNLLTATLAIGNYESPYGYKISEKQQDEGALVHVEQQLTKLGGVTSIAEDGIQCTVVILIEMRYNPGEASWITYLTLSAAALCMLFKFSLAVKHYLDEKKKMLEAGGLLKAASLGDVSAVEWLINQGKDPNDPAEIGDNEYTPLMSAAKVGHEKVVRVLLAAKADAAAANADGYTCLHAAADSVQNKSGAELAALAAACGATPESLYKRFDAILVMLLDAGADIEAVDNNGWTPLMDAAYFGNVTTVKLLTDRGANLDACDTDGKSIMDWARDSPRFAEIKAALEEVAEERGHVNPLAMG